MTLFDSFKRGMKKTRDLITGGLNRITASVTAFDETMLDELEALMVQADFGMAASTDILDRLKEKIRGGGSADRAQVTSYLKSIWLEILGSPRFLTVNHEAMTVILLVGVNGTGKTTTAGKLCHRFQSQGYKVMLAAADTFRAAAIDQLKHWGNVTQTPVVAHQVGADPASVVYDAISGAKARNADVLIIDTAGRLHNKKNQMDVQTKLRRVIEREAPQSHCESLLVIDATTGQNAVQQAKVFHETTEITGLVITKLDGNAKGGVAVAVAHQTQTPICLAGLGEGIDDLSDFDPQAFVNALIPDESESNFQ